MELISNAAVVKVVKREIKKSVESKGENLKMKSGFAKNKFLLVLLLTTFKFVSEIFTRELELGPCFLSFLEPCANNSIQFFLFSSERPEDEPVLLDNISPDLELGFNEMTNKTFKMIIHGYGGNLDFNGSKQIRNGKSSD